MSGGLRVGVAFNDSTLEASPTWTYITEEENLVAGATVDRGRQYELDTTDTGRASVAINDRDGILDPTNSSGPYYGLIDPLLQVKLDLWNPVTDAYSTIFRGYLEEPDYVFHPSQKVNQLTLGLVDAFDVLSRIKMQPDGSFGDTVPLGAEGQIFFDNANVDDRIIQVLGNAGWPTALQVIFSGNVSLQESTYSRGDAVLNVAQDATDAEFPGLGNLYVSRDGKVTFHGRLSRFDPATVAAGAGGAWTFTHWKAGDGAAVAASLSDTAHLREFSFNRGIGRVINYASSSPQGFDGDPASQVVLDAVSIGLRGFCSPSKGMDNLIVEAGTTTGNNANDECKLFATYYVVNYKDPRNRVTNIAFRSMRPDDPRAAANWAFLCGAEISDLLDVTVSSPGGGGFNAEPCFIEGVHYDIKPLNGEYADVTMRPDLSPQSLFSDGSMFGY